MTIKQRKFIKGYIKNRGNGTQAALDTYNVKNKHSAEVIASENLRKPEVRKQIEIALEANGLDDVYISELLREATVAGIGEKASNSDSLRGIEMMLKLKGAFPDKIQRSAHLRINYKKEVNEMSFNEISAKLKELQETTRRLLQDINA